MADTGYIQVHTYTSNAQFPLKDVAISITDEKGSAIAFRLTNSSGQLDQPSAIEVPNLSASQAPNSGTVPFTAVNLYARLEDYEQIEMMGLQVFPNTLTIQNLEMIPQSELPEYWNQVELFNTPPQNL